MSGPKSSDYDVARNLELERRALELARAQLVALDGDLRALIATAPDVRRRYAGECHITIPVVPTIDPKAGRSATERMIAEFRSLIKGLDAETKGIIASIETRRMLASVAARIAGPRRSASDILKPNSASPSKQPSEAELALRATEQRRQRQETIQRITNRAGAAITSQMQKDLESLAAEILSTSSEAQASLWMDELRLRIQRAVDEQKVKTAEAAEASQLLRKLIGLQGPEVEEVTQQLQSIEAQQGRLTNKLRERAEQIASLAKAEADGKYAAQVTEEVLAELGYEVEKTDLATLFVSGGKVQFQKPQWRDYWVRLKVSPDRGQLNFNIVRVVNDVAEAATNEQGARDKEMEEHWCPDHARLLELLAEKGISSNVTRHLPPGAVSVQIVQRSEGESVAAHRSEERPRALKRDLP